MAGYGHAGPCFAWSVSLAFMLDTLSCQNSGRYCSVCCRDMFGVIQFCIAAYVFGSISANVRLISILLR